MASMRYSKDFVWYNQMIGEIPVKKIRVRIFKAVDSVVSDYGYHVVATDGKTFQKKPHSSLLHTEDYSYVILSSEFRKRFSSFSDTLYLRIYITDTFDISTLKRVKFDGKKFALKALKKVNFSEKSYLLESLEDKPELYTFFKYFLTKLDIEHEEIFQLLKSSAELCDFDKVEELFKTYTIQEKYKTLFWKGMYREKLKS